MTDGQEDMECEDRGKDEWMDNVCGKGMRSYLAKNTDTMTTRERERKGGYIRYTFFSPLLFFHLSSTPLTLVTGVVRCELVCLASLWSGLSLSHHPFLCLNVRTSSPVSRVHGGCWLVYVINILGLGK